MEDSHMHLSSDPLSHINFLKIIHNQIKLSNLADVYEVWKC